LDVAASASYTQQVYAARNRCLQQLAPSTSTSPRRTPLAVDAVFVQPSGVTSGSAELHSRPPRSQSYVDLVQLARSAPPPRALPESPPQSSYSIASQAAVSARSSHFSDRAFAGHHASPKPK
jgi:hypothetical protein